jgi:CRISPR-associated endonuclease/helicase Cas3
MLVHRLLAGGRASGAYWAMPTQATANAMYARQADAIACLFDNVGDTLPSLTLGHGQSRLHAAYRRTVVRNPDDARETLEFDEPAERENAAAACAAFLADDRRASLLADVGVGTVDQALLGVLPSRFATLRLFALAEKVLVLDEVHAFDAYMSTELKQLLRFHAALGGSAVLLSATLSEPERRELENVWRTQTRFAPAAASTSDVSPYPMATIVNACSGDTAVFSPASASVARRITPVRLVHDEGEAVRHLLDTTEAGAAGVWIRNTVDECLRAADVIASAGRTPIVFHARFAQGDRQRIEHEVMARFGVESTPADRSGAILIATQVVEQSLDLDFDVMVSDLAPIDLLIQRAGRLWRHRRGMRTVASPELLVLCPSVAQEPNASWPDPLLRNTRYVYDSPGVMWRTALALRECAMIDSPHNIRALIERVYERDEVPEVLRRADLESQGKEYGAVAMADTHVLRLTDGYAAGTVWSDDLRARTRLGEDQVPVRLARVAGDRLVPWISDTTIPEWQRWSLSEVKLSAKRVAWDATCAPEWQSQVETVRAAWSRFEQRTPVVVLQKSDDARYSGTLVRSGKTITLEYDEKTGASFVK